MSRNIRFFSVVFILTIISGTLSSQALSYTRLTNGLDSPAFEGGRTNYEMGNINLSPA